MANREQIKILMQGAETWNEWRDENDVIRPNLRRAHLLEADLGEAILIEANLFGTSATIGGTPGRARCTPCLVMGITNLF